MKSSIIEELRGACSDDPMLLAILAVVREALPEHWVANPLAWYHPFKPSPGGEWDICVFLREWPGISEELRKRIDFVIKVEGSEVYSEWGQSDIKAKDFVADLTHPRSLRRIKREVRRLVEALEKYVVTRLGDPKRLLQLEKNQPHKLRKRLRSRKPFRLP
jgi:hypothetical protein